MLVQIVTENGQKKIIPLTADAGAGNPVGTIIPMYKKSSPSGYLYCDGSTFDETQYPLLYAYLGSNVLPDYREFALVGAEENTTDVYNASTNPTGTIHDHDVYTEGQAKDDQLQGHGHDSITDNTQVAAMGSGSTGWETKTYDISFSSRSSHTTNTKDCRYGKVTRGKRKAVYFYIKATSGLSENAQDNVVAQLNEERSYSTEEINTGKKWIDGKPIYRKVVDCGALPNSTTKNVAHGINNLKKVIKSEGYSDDNAGTHIPVPYVSGNPLAISVDTTNIIIQASGNYTNFVNTQITLEYTKTTKTTD